MQKVKIARKCRACNSKKLINILSLGKHYLSDFAKKRVTNNKYPLELILCDNCSLLQMKHTVSKEVLYTQRYGYKSGINETMKNELKEIVDKSQKILKKNKTKNLVAVDIGANDGTLLSNYSENVFRIGIEPIKKFANDCKKHADIVISDFFNYSSYFNKAKNRKADIITAISCFYDIENPNKFLSDVKKILHNNGIFIIQQNYLVKMLKNNAYDNIVHEHLEHYSLLSLENLLKRHNLEVFNVEISDVNGGSFRTYISCRGIRKISNSVLKMRDKENELLLKNKKIYLEFAKRVRRNKQELFKLLNKLKNKKKEIFIYGASTRGNTLLQYCKLNNKLIGAAVERNPEKWGKKISSLGIPIISEHQARREMPDYMLVLPWFFKQEFLRREKNYLDTGGHFIFPLPRVVIV